MTVMVTVVLILVLVIEIYLVSYLKNDLLSLFRDIPYYLTK